MAKLISTNPAKNYEVVGEVEISTGKEITKKISDANKAKIVYGSTGVAAVITPWNHPFGMFVVLIYVLYLKM
ncbi:MAG: hypothetical protein U9R34_01685 [Nanoarchaeota archaeon]|nr:hypothetical protein [Nanoarchaeota archaeon]